MILPVTEAIVNELTSQQLGNRDSKRIRKLSQQQSLNNNNNNYQQHNNNLHDAEQMNHSENNNMYVSLVSMSTKNDKVATISIKEAIVPASNGAAEKSAGDIPIDADENKTLRVAFFLSIAYASNIGGTGTLTGTGPNLVLQGIMDEYYPNLNDLSFGKQLVSIWSN